MARQLLDNGIKVDTTENVVSTPLYWAVADGKTGVTRLFLDSGLKADSTDNVGWIPVHLTPVNEKMKVDRLLLDSKANSTSRNYFLMQELKLTFPIAKHSALPPHTLLHISHIEKKGDVKRLLLENGADIHCMKRIIEASENACGARTGKSQTSVKKTERKRIYVNVARLGVVLIPIAGCIASEGVEVAVDVWRHVMDAVNVALAGYHAVDGVQS